jgi:hypothetical protein
MHVVEIASLSESGGKMVGIRFASIVFPAPGDQSFGRGEFGMTRNILFNNVNTVEVRIDLSVIREQ